ILAFQWHHYTFQLPTGATELARSDVCTQAFRIGERAWGIQFHAEVTLAMVEIWTTEDPDDVPVASEEFLAATRARIADWNEQGRALCGAFLQAALT
ncbi:MAG: type 1 glutamine amidotransferase, partial [Actinobacteria bacterium]|nr:type 1 glutamine amidotransferase [Actinomycetota bacterium]